MGSTPFLLISNENAFYLNNFCITCFDKLFNKNTENVQKIPEKIGDNFVARSRFNPLCALYYRIYLQSSTIQLSLMHESVALL